MASTTSTSSTDLVARAQRLQFLTIAWMTVKAAIALGAAWKARSPALFGFGGDSLIELLSEVVVPWRFRSQTETETARSEKIPARIAGGLLFSVALFVATASSFGLLGYYEPRTSVVGIALLVVAAFGMPWLAEQKRKLAIRLSSTSLRADAAESSLCGVPIVDRACRTRRQRTLWDLVGGPSCRTDSSSIRSQGRMASHPCLSARI